MDDLIPVAVAFGLLLFIVLPMIVILARRQVRITKARMEDLARKLGGLQIAETAPTGPDAQVHTGPLANWRATGSHRGRRIRLHHRFVRTRASQRSTLVRQFVIDISTTAPDALVLSIERPLSESTSNAAIASSTDASADGAPSPSPGPEVPIVELDDAQLAERACVRCDDAEFARAVLTPKLMAALVRFLDERVSWAPIQLGDGKWSYAIYEGIIDDARREHAEAMVGVLCDLANSGEDVLRRRRGE